MAKKKNNRMYGDRRENIGIVEGCPFDCIYCAFKKLQHRFGAKTEDIEYIPHVHSERLNKKPKWTEGTQFTTIGLNGDISCATDEVMKKIIKYCTDWSDRTFLLQSKDPKRFIEEEANTPKFRFPKNVILCTTIETNKFNFNGHPTVRAEEGYNYGRISKAPHPGYRAEAMILIQDNRKIITMEPILDFDPDILKGWIEAINPIAVYIGYDSGGHKLPEPSLQKTLEFIESIKPITEVRTKLLRKAWWEERE